MSCNHHHVDTKNEKKLLITIFLNILITLSQFIGGIISGSLALMSDALHNLSDVVSLVISYVAEKMSKREFTDKETFGFKRIEILAALFNSTTLIVVALYLMYSAFISFFETEHLIQSEYVIFLALLSIIFNGASVFILFKESKNNINIRASYLHLLSDMITSVAVMIGGILMYYFSIYWIDSILTIFIGIYLLKEAMNIVKETYGILMNFTPHNISIYEIEKEILAIENIKNIHHVHVWSLTENQNYFEAHIDLNIDLKLSETDLIIKEIKNILKEKFNIKHSIIQPEFSDLDNKSLIVLDHEH